LCRPDAQVFNSRRSGPGTAADADTTEFGGRAPRINLMVDVHVTIHNSGIGISQETLDDLVDHLQEEAHFQVEKEKEKADAAAIQLKIDVFMEEGGKFKVDGDLDGPKEEVENGHDHEEKIAERRIRIDDMVTAIVHDFIHFIHHA
jgi:hypothetical protein